MDDVTRHPDDATLFDLVEEALEPARAATVQAHLARCSACAAFVVAARAGAPVTNSAVEAMPDASAAKLDAAVKTAWRERVAGIAAAEAAQDASASGAARPGAEIATTPVAVPAPGGAGEFAGFAPSGATGQATPPPPSAATPARTPARASAPPRRRGRRIVPVLAFVVLGTLAGTSILIGNERRTSDTTTVGDNGAETADNGVFGELPAATTVDPAAPSLDADATAPDSAGESAAPDGAGAQGAAGPAAGGPTAGSATSEGAPKDARDATAAAGGAANEPEAMVEPPPADYDEFVDQDRVCIATLDEAQLALPDGRIPTQITQGPFGIYLVCG